jgi:hypothetical protein
LSSSGFFIDAPYSIKAAFGKKVLARAFVILELFLALSIVVI